MGVMPEEEKENMRRRGTSEHEIAYYDAAGQKDYEPLLKDPTTPTEVLDRIVDWLTMLPLKLLAFKHPNISTRSQRYMLEKADKKPYQKDIIEALLSNEKPFDEPAWVRLRNSFNTAGRFDHCVMELMEEQKDIFTTARLHGIFNAFHKTGLKTLKLADRYLLAIFEHKNFDVSILDGALCRDSFIFNNTDLLNAINATKNKDAICVKLYEMTDDANWLPTKIKDIFIF